MPSPHITAQDLIHAVAGMNCGVIGRDFDGKILYANERILDWLGYTARELLGSPIQVLVPPELDELMHEEMRARDEGDLRARITVICRKDSTTIPVLVIPSADMETEDGSSGYFTIIVELAAVQTAKPAGYMGGSDLRADLERIALQLQALGLSAAGALSRVVPLEHPDLGTLSTREKEVLSLLMGGKRVPSIATRLHISPHTVRNHLKSMFRQLGVNSQATLIERVHALAAPVGR